MSILKTLSYRRKFVAAYRLLTNDTAPFNLSVKETCHAIKFHFPIPSGISPTTFQEKSYVFMQAFHDNISLIEHSSKWFTLHVYKTKLPSNIPYDVGVWAALANKQALPIVVGYDRTQAPICFDLAVDPHVLLSGETGSGKSSLLRCVLTTLILNKSPEDVRLVLGDLKRSEFGIYRNLPHVDGVHTSVNTLGPALLLIRNEMERRGNLLDENEVTHISELPTELPYIIVCIDEVALLRKEKDILSIIEDISSIGRSLGILLILSLQRPDAKVLEGRLKNNLTVRISGRQSNATNAKVAGVPGADKIKKTAKGRMLYVLDEPTEIQSPWLSAEEAKELLAPLKQSKPAANNKPNEFTFGVLEDEDEAAR